MQAHAECGVSPDVVVVLDSGGGAPAPCWRTCAGDRSSKSRMECLDPIAALPSAVPGLPIDGHPTCPPAVGVFDGMVRVAQEVMATQGK
jgi:hypothetical protein